MANIITRTISVGFLIGLFALLHLFHLISHSIRLSISILENLTDQLDHFLIIFRFKKRRDVKKDLKHLIKLPSHLAIIWIPINHQLFQFLSLRSFSLFHSKIQRLQFQQQVERDAIIQNLTKILAWSMEAGIKEITFYEERGLLKSPEFELGAFQQYLTNDPVLMGSNSNILPLSLHPKIVDDSIIITYKVRSNTSLSSSSSIHDKFKSKSKSTILSNKSSPIPQSIKVNLIERNHGHEHIVQVTKALLELTHSHHDNKLNFDLLNVKTIGDKICSTSIGMPDLLMVLGGRSIRFRGFPPWQLALTEIYHGRSYGILPYRIRYREFLKALILFGNCEQRCGA